MKMLSKATDIAKALNFGKYPVLKMNLDTKEGSKAVVIHKSARYGDMRHKCTLEMDYDKIDDGILYLSANATCIKANYDWLDHLECTDYANAPVISADEEVAVYMYSPKLKVGYVRIVKSGKIDSRCSVATIFRDVED